MRVFKAILALNGPWHLEKSRTRAEIGKPKFSGARGPEMEKKGYHAIRDGCPQLFDDVSFPRLDPHGREIAKFQAILAQDVLWH